MGRSDLIMTVRDRRYGPKTWLYNEICHKRERTVAYTIKSKKLTIEEAVSGRYNTGVNRHKPKGNCSKIV